jgi:hypothetical protein
MKLFIELSSEHGEIGRPSGVNTHRLMRLDSTPGARTKWYLVEIHVGDSLTRDLPQSLYAQ